MRNSRKPRYRGSHSDSLGELFVANVRILLHQKLLISSKVIECAVVGLWKAIFDAEHVPTLAGILHGQRDFLVAMPALALVRLSTTKIG